VTCFLCCRHHHLHGHWKWHYRLLHVRVFSDWPSQDLASAWYVKTLTSNNDFCLILLLWSGLMPLSSRHHLSLPEKECWMPVIETRKTCMLDGYDEKIWGCFEQWLWWEFGRKIENDARCARWMSSRMEQAKTSTYNPYSWPNGPPFLYMFRIFMWALGLASTLSFGNCAVP
jgi:hypothetical protein